MVFLGGSWGRLLASEYPKCLVFGVNFSNRQEAAWFVLLQRQKVIAFHTGGKLRKSARFGWVFRRKLKGLLVSEYPESSVFVLLLTNKRFDLYCGSVKGFRFLHNKQIENIVSYNEYWLVCVLDRTQDIPQQQQQIFTPNLTEVRRDTYGLYLF